MPVRMELSRILIRELNDYQIIELREVAPVADDVAADGAGPSPASGGAGGGGAGVGGAGGAGGAGGSNGFSQVEGGRSFPIVIGLPEAQAIERRLKGIQIKRPQTHDLLMNVIAAMGGRLESITINDLSEQTFFALLHVRDRAGKLVDIDSRPSDAIALGIASNVPIFVAEHVLDAVQKNDDETE
jgi:bifunctional DNase/RNase